MYKKKKKKKNTGIYQCHVLYSNPKRVGFQGLLHFHFLPTPVRTMRINNRRLSSFSAKLVLSAVSLPPVFFRFKDLESVLYLFMGMLLRTVDPFISSESMILCKKCFALLVVDHVVHESVGQHYKYLYVYT